MIVAFLCGDQNSVLVPALWLTILDFMDKFMHASGSELLMEAIPESLKDMLLVMETAGVFDPPSDTADQDVRSALSCECLFLL